MPHEQRSPFGRLARTIGLTLAGLIILLLLVAALGALYLAHADLKPVAERAAGDALGRRVTLGSLEVRWGDPLGIEFTDLVIANASWGSGPDMVRIGRFSALIDLRRLLRGVIRYRRLRLADVTIVLERDPDGVGNWAFGGGGAGAFAVVPKNRTQFPSLLDFAGERALITYRTRTGKVLGIRLDRVAISSPGDDTPAQLLAQGAYGDVPLQLDAVTDSYATLRNSAVPFGARFTLRGDDTDLAFNGRLWNPLDFDGVRGELSIDARTPDDILGVLGSKKTADLPFAVAGILRRDGDHWLLASAKGQVKDSHFSGDLGLDEGRPGNPDDIALDLDFSALDADAIAASLGGKDRPAGLAAIRLRAGGRTGVDVSAALTALRATIGGQELHAVALQGRLADGEVALKELSFALGGGSLSMSGALAASGEGGRLELQARLSKANVSRIAGELGGTGDQIRGRLDGAATLSMTGSTVGTALRHSSGAAVVTLRGGRIARELVERLSVDLRSLFRSTAGSVPVSCLLGIMTLKDGIGVLSPLRLESREAVAAGAGKIDFTTGRLELTVKTERDSTDFFALDIPIRISGPLGRLSAEPLVGNDADWLKQPAAAAANLPPELDRLASGNDCLQ